MLCYQISEKIHTLDKVFEQKINFFNKNIYIIEKGFTNFSSYFSVPTLGHWGGDR